MSKVYVVCWGHAGIDDKGNGQAYSNVHGVYNQLADAQRGLIELKDEFVDEIINNPEFDEDEQAMARNRLQVYGSVEEGYFELDNDVCDFIEETYLVLVEKEVM